MSRKPNNCIHSVMLTMYTRQGVVMAVVNAAVLFAAIAQIAEFENSKADLGTINGTVWGRQNCKMTGGVEKVYVTEVVVAGVGVCIYVIEFNQHVLETNLSFIAFAFFQAFGAFACSRKRPSLIAAFYYAHGQSA